MPVITSLAAFVSHPRDSFGAGRAEMRREETRSRNMPGRRGGEREDVLQSVPAIVVTSVSFAGIDATAGGWDRLLEQFNVILVLSPRGKMVE